MLLNFRQGVVAPLTNFLVVNGSNNVDLIVASSTAPVIITVAQSETNYVFSESTGISSAWVGPFSSTSIYWLYWNFDLETFSRTFGYTTLQPIIQGTAPISGSDSYGIPILTSGRMWYNTATNVNSYYSGTIWIPCLRVFAAVLNNGSFQSISTNLGSFTGSQIGNNTPSSAGRVLFDNSSNTLHHEDGTFVTTEDQFFVNGSSIDAVRLESNVTTAACADPSIAAYTVVAYNINGGLNAANYIDIGNTVLGIVTQDLSYAQSGSVTLQGVVTNLAWNWLAQFHANGNPVEIGDPFWVNNGILQYDDPHVIDAVTYPIGNVPVARLLSTNTVIFDQGLGGKGDQGPAGSLAEVAITAVSTSLGLTIAGSPVPTNGTLTFGLNPELSGLSGLAAQGLVTRTGVGTYLPRTITGTSRISVTNANGALGNPLIDVVESSLVLSNISGILPIAQGGTGQTTTSSAINALLPPQLTNAGLVLATDGTNVTWTAVGGGTVLSVSAIGGTGITVIGSPITGTGTLTITNTGVTSIVVTPPLFVSSSTGSVVLNVVPFSSTVSGIVPASGGGTTNYLRADGTWNAPTLTAGTVTSVAASISGVGLSVAGSPITTNGTLVFALGTELQGLSSLSTSGLVARTGSGIYTAVILTSGSSNITITNGSGATGSPIIDLNIAALTSLPVLNISESQVTGLISSLASKNNAIQYQNSGTNIGTPGVSTVVNFSTGLVASSAGSTITVAATGAGGGGTGTVTGVDVQPQVGTIGLSSTGGPVTSSGVIFLSLSSELQGLSVLASNGFIQRTGAGTYSTLTIPLSITNGGTGQITANAALNALLPVQTGNGGFILSTDGANSHWISVLSGVTSFNTRTGAITLSSTDVNVALGYIPATQNTFTSSVSGLVPASGGGTINFLRADGAWVSIAAGGSGSVTSVAATGSTGLVVGGSPITTTGTLTFTLGTELQGLSGLASNGFVQRTGAGTYVASNLISSEITTALGFTPIAGNQSISLTGDITGSGTTNIATTLTTVNGTVGTFGDGTHVPAFTVNAKGLVTGVTATAISFPAVSIAVASTDLSVSGSPITGTGTITLNLNTSGVAAGTYNNLTVNSKGIVTNASSLLYAQTNVANSFTKAQTSTPVTVAIISNVLTINASLSNVFYVSHNANITSSSITSPTDGQLIKIVLTETIGGNTVNWPSNFTFLGSSAIDSTVTHCNVVTAVYDASLTQWLAVLNTQNITGVVTSVAATGSAGLTVGGSPITSNGTLIFTLGTELQALSGLSTLGIIKRTGTGAYSVISSLHTDVIFATAGQTIVSLTNVTATSRFPTGTTSFIQVFLNGVLQREDNSSGTALAVAGSFYVSSATTITFFSALALNNEVTVYQLLG